MIHFRRLLAAAITLIFSATSLAAQNAPAVSLSSVMDYRLFDDGRMRIGDTDLAFAPAGSPQMRVEIRKKTGERVKSYPFYDTYRLQVAVFGRATADGQAMHKFAPGDYALDFKVKGQLVTTVPFSVSQASVSSDPFAPGTSYRFTGPWQKWAYVATDRQRSGDGAALFFWAGSNDVDTSATGSRQFIAKLYRGSTLIGHSKRRAGIITRDWMQRHKSVFLKPHPKGFRGTPNAVPMSELTKPGSYRVEVELTDTGEKVRSFSFTSAGGKITPHVRSALGYQPQADYVFPRGPGIRTQKYDWREINWISN
ncbi:hypothetical protein [uncultured Erythrobacter sp.]|uniref:hypothetical protein n=1 Tax=uncultured Erythrobacter sp. TaxID=263913 RepID=UPI00261591D1|nr:hypothetical protein [uncultured Erythrobacter sp.]